MLETIVDLFLMALIATNIYFSDKQTKEEKKIIKAYEDNTEAAKQLKNAIDVYFRH